MVKFGSARSNRLVQFGCGFLAAGSLAAFGAPGACAEPLEGATGPVEEALVEPVRGATEAVPAPAPQVTETLTEPVRKAMEVVAPPVHEATESVAPRVKEAAETVIRPAKEVTEAVKLPVKVQVPADTSGSSSAGTVKAAGRVVQAVTGMATHPTEDAIAANDPVVASPDPGSSDATPGSGDGIFVAPPSDGAVRAPPPKWMAFVWPAIALMRPARADLLGRRAPQSLPLAPATGVGSGEGPVVAGVHASGGRPDAAASSSSPFSKIRSALGHAFGPDVPMSALAFLCLAAFAVVAVAAAVRREIVVGRREGRGR